MAKEITVTLSNDQVSQMTSDGRILYPDASNEELEAMMTDAAKHQGVYTLAGVWRLEVIKQQENRETERDDFYELFPPPAVPTDPDPTGF